jgi:hypothetical protein
VRANALRVVAITLLLVGTARADAVDDLIDKLDDSSDRVRITAVLGLTRQESPRSIDALAKTLNNKGEQKNIRGLAASALGRIVQNGKPNASQKKAAIDALTRASADPDPFVSSKASAALTQAGASTPTTGPSTSTNGVYVNVGPMAVNAPGADKAKNRARMEKMARDTFIKTEPKIKLTWPGGKVPTKQDLDGKGIAGFYVDGTLNELKVTKNGAEATVTCKVSMLLASFPDKAVFGFLNGGAAVTGGSSQREIDLAQQDCVDAVVEELIAKKIIPTIRTKATP